AGTGVHTECLALDASDGHRPRARVEVDIALRVGDGHAPRAGIEGEMPASSFGGDIRVSDIDGEIGIDCRYASFTDSVMDDDALSLRNEHTKVRVRLEPRA